MNPDIIIIGAGIIDILVRPVTEEVFSIGTWPAEDILMSTGGDAMNEALILAHLGVNVQLNTVTGTDRAGQFLTEICKSSGVDLPASCIRPDIITGINVVLVCPDGARNFLTNPKGSLRSLKLSDIPLPFPNSARIICFASIFVFPHFGTEELKILFSEAKKQEKIVCADMTRCKHQETQLDLAPALAYVDYLFPNDTEAMTLTRTDCVEDAAEKLLEAGVKNVVIKCGNKGCYIQNRKEAYRLPALPDVSCIDTTGAGDSFVAGFLYRLSKGFSLRECAEYGNVCGAKSVATVGATDWITNPQNKDKESLDIP